MGKSFLLAIVPFSMLLVSGGGLHTALPVFEEGVEVNAKAVTVDGYPLEDARFKNHKDLISGNAIALDLAWFTNIKLKQTLAVELYTDYFRVAYYHFYNDAIPPGMVKKMSIMRRGSEALMPVKEQTTALHGFIKQAAPVSARYFTTFKGFKLGDSKQKALTEYGKPHVTTIKDGYDYCEWNYAGDLLTNTKTPLIKPLAKDSYGYQVTMYFKQDKLAAMVLYNDIP